MAYILVCHSVDDRIPFNGIEIIKNGTKAETQVYRKSTNTGLLLHFHSNTDKCYRLFIKDNVTSRFYTVFHNRGFKWRMCQIAPIFSRLDYPWSLKDSAISNFDSQKPSVSSVERNADKSNIVIIINLHVQ